MKPYKQENEKVRRPRKKRMQDEVGYEKTLSFSWTMLPFYPVLSMQSQPNVYGLHPGAIHTRAKLIGGNNEGSLQGLLRVQSAIGSL